MPNVAVQEGFRPRKDQQVRPAEGYRDAARPRLRFRSQQKLDIAPSISDRPLEHLSDEPLRLLVENAQQLKESSSVVVDKDGQVVTE